MTRFIDRRQQSRHKNAVNRSRFIKRFKLEIKKAVANAISSRSITNIENGEEILIPVKDTKEPFFHYNQGGKQEIVLPGNQHFLVGDKIKRPPTLKRENGSQASDQGEGEDNFSFQLSTEEFLDIFFDDLALPNLVKTQISKINTEKWIRAGYMREGVPANINILRSLKGALGRRLAAKSNLKKQISKLEEDLNKTSTQETTEKDITKKDITNEINDKIM